MKNIYFTLAILLFAFSGCKDKDATDNSESIDTTVVNQDTAHVDHDTITIDTASMESVDTTDAKSNVQLPNKVSTTNKVVPGEKGKFALAETKWGLVELNGKAIETRTRRDYFINFDSKSGTFRAFVGCNTMSGKYFMKSEGKLGFSDVISTRKACDNMNDERNFFNNLQKIDNYMIEADGKKMHLHIGKKAVAKFEAIR